MSTNERQENVSEDFGSYIVIDGIKRRVVPSTTEFSVDVKSQTLQKEIAGADVRQLAIGRSRVVVKDEKDMEAAIASVRNDPAKAVHRVYRLADTDEEINITDSIFLTLERADLNQVRALADEYKLELKSEQGNIYELKVTSALRRNPLKIANEIAKRKGVLSCAPKLLFSMQFSEAAAGSASIQAVIDRHPLFKKQWYLSATGITDPLLVASASINVKEAWDAAGSMGDSSVVIAVIDDGFDLPLLAKPAARHDAFKGSIIDTAHMKNFGDKDNDNTDEPDSDIRSRGTDFHGTSVASLICARDNSMLGVAPGCTLLPVRIGSSENMDPDNLLKFLGAAAPFADVVNCCFSLTPSSVQLIKADPTFVGKLRKLMKEGGRRPGKGLIVVFSAGNDDAPISMSAEDNKNGITFVENKLTAKKPAKLGPGQPVHCGYSELSGAEIPGGPIPGLIVVGAMSSLKRRAGYSNWGDELTVVAPSDNGHALTKLEPGGEQKVRERFPGLAVIAAINRSGGHGGRKFNPLVEDLSTATIFESALYTDEFGGTSASAPLVSGVIGLMISVNQNLTAEQVVKILKENADDSMKDKQLLDFENDPNLQGIKGTFSQLFGSGKVDAAKAVQAAKDLL